MNKETAQLEVKEITHEQETVKDLSILKNAPLYQMPFYGDWQKALNRKVKRYIISKNGSPFIYFQTISYPLIGDYSYLYIPYGPLLIEPDPLNPIDKPASIFLKKILEELSKKEKAVFCRLDFTPSVKNTTADMLATIFFRTPRFSYKGAYFQPRVEWALNLQPAPAELLAAMHQKTRYSINLAKRKNLTVELVEENFLDYFDIFYTLSKQTADRDGFNLHPKEYYQAVFASGEKNKNMTLVLVRFEDEVLIANLIVYYGSTAMYVYGSSSNNHRNRMPAYLAQWEAILHAQKRGATEYNFGGIHTEAFPHKSWEGITYFKKNFGGYELVHSPFFDVVGKPFWYSIYTLRKLFKK